jgi:hypothetical protein
MKRKSGFQGYVLLLINCVYSQFFFFLTRSTKKKKKKTINYVKIETKLQINLNNMLFESYYNSESRVYD